MNTEKQMSQFLASLAAAFPGDVPPTRLEIYLRALRSRLEVANLRTLHDKLILECEFFPTAKRILDCLEPRKQTHRELAAEFVDTMLALFQGSGNVWEIAGADNYRFWKETVNLTRMDLQNIETQYHRSSWIDKVERAYLDYEKEQALLHSQNIARIEGNTSEPA